MRPRNLLVLLTLAQLTLTDRIRQLRHSADRGSETAEKVMWIALLVGLALSVFAIFRDKIIGKVSGINL
ncbi:hypothetical protein ACGFIE_00400 [Micromonospora sp. NPDC049275]|uniref:hypothetical protein n=1 Tax=unclassified Micromonospora TaxID=2617518 RepID=UPI00241635DC|nr:hypothetical protein [Micromonospora sp. WMMD710]MDG4760348.1 hypothetical protein [Micromonospora sp. WMMD710]